MKKNFLVSLVLGLTMMVTLVLAAVLSADAASSPGDYIFDISEGDIAITAGTNADTLMVVYGDDGSGGQLAEDNIPQESEITITGTATTKKVLISEVTTNINLQAVDIQPDESVSASPIHVSTGADVNFNLKGVNTLVGPTNCAGLQVDSDAKIQIDGVGRLNATGGNRGAGIGGSDGASGGDITISGGIVTAKNFEYAAGIGGGSDGDGGMITISGGTVSAIGWEAGIGGGNGRDGGTIVISGGTVSASSLGAGAGIGGGYHGDGGNITISGGSVTAKSANYTAGIGGGLGGDGGTITISGGEVDAQGTDAGIGGGNGGDGGTITISAGTVSAISIGGGAGIGGGYHGAPGNITILKEASLEAFTVIGSEMPAIHAVAGHLEAGSTAKVLMVNYSPATDNYNIAVFVKDPFAEASSIAPTLHCSSVAVIVPENDTYQVMSTNKLQENSGGPGIDFVISTDGLTVFNSVQVAGNVPDAEAVKVDKWALSNNMIKGSNADLTHVDQSLDSPLPSAGSFYESEITWESNRTEIVSNSGTVERPSFGLGNAAVALTATIAKGSGNDIKQFNLTVIQQTMADAGAMKAWLDANERDFDLTNYAELDETGKTAVAAEIFTSQAALTDQESIQSAITAAIAAAKIDSDARAAADAASITTVKGLIEGAIYTMTQAEAASEEAVIAAVESEIASLALDEVTPAVSKVLYTPATAGDAGTPAGSDGTYTFTVDLSKGEASATTAVLTMTISATPFDVAAANAASVETVKGLVEAETYAMTLDAASDEDAVKAAIEAQIASLAMDGVTPIVTKVSYTPAATGSDGTYIFTVDLSKGDISATTAALTMTITDLWSVSGNYDLDLYQALAAKTAGDTIAVSTPQQLAAVAKAVNDHVEFFSGKTVVLTENIDLGLHKWNPIGSAGSADTVFFQGNFNGNGHTISNMHISGEQMAAGLFAVVGGREAEPATVQNLTVDGTIDLEGEIAAVGGIAGMGMNASFINCSNGVSISVTSTVTSSDSPYTGVGGILGIGVMRADITDCTNKSTTTINITSSSPIVGGILGFGLGMEKITVVNSVNHGTVIAVDTDGGSENGAGGIAGAAIGTSIVNCYNSGNLSTTGSVGTGGIFGLLGIEEGDSGGAVQNCYSTGLLTIDSDGLKGGIAGRAMISNLADLSSCSYLDTTATYAYYDYETMDAITVDGAAKTSAQMKDAAYLETLNGWVGEHTPFDDTELKTWIQQAAVNDGYPAFSGDYIPGADSVAAVMSLIEGTTFTMTQAAAADEAAVKAAIEAKIADLALDGVAASVSKVLYIPAAAGDAGTPAGTNGTYTFTVDLSKEAASATTVTLTMTVTATAYQEHAHGGSSPKPVTQPVSAADILVNGDPVPAETAVVTQEDGKTVTTVTVDALQLEQKLALEGDRAKVTITVNTNSDKIIGELNGQMVKNMANKLAVVEIKTAAATYTLPAQQINIDAVSRQLGTAVELKDIRVTIEIAKPAEETVKVIADSARAGEYSVVAPALEFTISCSYNGRTIAVSKFNAYVARTIAIPDGVDKTKITTGVIMDPDGTVRHVPTQVIVIDGKYYAKISSLSNSTYYVVWHPVAFADMKDHWAKEAVNDMGSRMVISGVGSGLFEPDRDITRAEFAAIMVSALGLKSGTDAHPFDDVKTSDWYSDAVKTAFEYQIISGCGQGKFKPNDKITREQAMSMIAGAMRITGLNSELEDSDVRSLLAKYADGAVSANYAQASIAKCLKTGIITGRSSRTIAPKDAITRAEAAAIVQRLLQKSNLI